MVATGIHTVGKRAVRILLECCLVITEDLSPFSDTAVLRVYNVDPLLKHSSTLVIMFFSSSVTMGLQGPISVYFSGYTKLEIMAFLYCLNLRIN